MKKFAIFLLCLLLVGSLWGCGQGQPPVDASSAEPTDPTDPTNPTEPTEPIDPTEPPATLAPTDPPVDMPTDSLDENLISTLTSYLRSISNLLDCNAIDPVEPSDATLRLGWAINRAKSGQYRALGAATDNESRFFVCAYYDCSHEEKGAYCCVDAYTWVGFFSETGILEFLDGAQLIAAFQVNEMHQCTNLVTDENVAMAYCQEYEPTFVNGYNTASPLICNESLVFFTHKQEPIYYVKEYHSALTVPCVSVDDQLYLVLRIGTQDANGTIYYYDLQSAYDDYYDALMGVMDTDLYGAPQEDGSLFLYRWLNLKYFEEILKN